MNESEWEKTLWFKEVTTYLNDNDKTELSLCSKFLNSKLYNTLLIQLDLNKFMKFNKYRLFEVSISSNPIKLAEAQDEIKEYNLESGINEDFNFVKTTYFTPYKPMKHKFNEEITRFKRDLLNFGHQAQSLTVDGLFDYCYMYQIPSTLKNIKELSLNSVHIPTELLKFLLANINLTALTIDNCNFIHIKSDPFILDIKLPQTLIDLSCKLSWINFIDDDQKCMQFGDFPRLGLEFTYFFLAPEHLPKLIKLSYFGHSYDHLANSEEFIRLNPQLQYLNINIDLLSSNVLNLIQAKKKLSLDISCHSSRDLGYLDDFVLHSVSELKIVSVRSYGKFVMKSLKLCPNVNELCINYIDSESLNEKLSIFDKFYNLKKLSIYYSNHSDVILKNLELPKLNKLEELKLKKIHLNTEELEYLSKFPNLKRISVDKETWYQFNNELHKNEDSILKNWRIINYPKIVTYNKL